MTPDFTHLSPRELASHAAHRLAAADILRVSDHLAGCAVCREAFNRTRVPTGEFPVGPKGGMPTFAELDGAVSGTLTPAAHESLAAKLAASPAAQDALADLAAFRDELTGLPVKFHGPARPPEKASTPGAAANVIAPPLWRWRGIPAWAGGLAAVLVALAVWWGAFAHTSQNGAALLHDDRGRPVNLAGLPAGLRTSIEDALRSGQLPAAPTSALVTTRGELAGAATEATMATTAPVGIIVREALPVLCWTARTDATGYRVTIVATEGGAALSSPLLPATEIRWMPSMPLPRGKTYAWQVAALHDGKIIDRAPRPPAGEAQFAVLDAGHDTELSRVETQASGNPLVLGMAYWRAGLTDAAREQFQRLARTHAQSSIAQQLESAAVREKETR